MQIELTEGEAATLRFYLNKALIDAEGMAAIGVANRQSADNLKSVIKKIGGPHGKQK